MLTKKIISLLFALLGISLVLSCSDDKPVATNDTVDQRQTEYDFSDRTYILNSDGAESSTPSPLLIVLHGANSSGRSMIVGTQINEMADDRGYIVLYPDAYQGLWNFGKECNPAYPDRPDDMEFIKYLIEKISQEFTVDENRIYVTGFSMGGFFSFYLARHLSDKIAAFAPVAAIMPRFIGGDPDINPVPILLTVGTFDTSVPYDGTGTGNCSSMSAPESIKFWAELSGCDTDPTITYLPDNGIFDLRTRIETFNNCELKNDVIFVVIEGGGHSWQIDEEINTTQIIFDFFEDKSL